MSDLSEYSLGVAQFFCMLRSETNHPNTSFPLIRWSFGGYCRRRNNSNRYFPHFSAFSRTTTSRIYRYCTFVRLKKIKSTVFLRHWWIMRRSRLCLSVMGIQPLHRWSTMQHIAPLQGFSWGCKSVSQAVMGYNGVTETSPLPWTFHFCSSHCKTSFSNPS